MTAVHHLQTLALVLAACVGLLTGEPARALEPNQQAPELDVKLLNGKTIKAKDLKGKVVVTMFWATWCPTCRTSLPELQRFYSEQHAKGLEIVALSIDENPKDVREFVKAKRLTLPVGMRTDPWFDHYGRVAATPTIFITDRQGIVRHRLAGTPTTAEKIEQLVLPLM